MSQKPFPLVLRPPADFVLTDEAPTITVERVSRVVDGTSLRRPKYVNRENGAAGSVEPEPRRHRARSSFTGLGIIPWLGFGLVRSGSVWFGLVSRGRARPHRRSLGADWWSTSSLARGSRWPRLTGYR